MTDHTVTIAGAAGMWGDSTVATPQLLAHGGCDYFIYESLAEITMAVLSRAWRRDPGQGYARDVISIIGRYLGSLREQGIRVVTNAGGVSPAAATAALAALGEQAGVKVSVATVTGDGLADRMDLLRNFGITEMFRGTALPEDPLSINAYLGARPIAAALDAGADVVITGRCVDSALVLGPLIHEFGWGPGDLDALAQGSLAGHLLECGPQSCGGILTDWQATSGWVTSGFPIAEVQADGSFVITTPADSDGLVDRRTVTEQLVYEIGDPRRYVLPDVVCDFTAVTVDEVGPNRVAVCGARGRPPTPTLKACAQVTDGYRTQWLACVAGRDAPDKGRRMGEEILARCRRRIAAEGFDDFRNTSVEVLGAEGTDGANARPVATREVVVKVAVHHDDPAAVTLFAREFPSIGMGGPPGLSLGGSGVPRTSPLIRLENFLVPRDLVPVAVELDGEQVAFTDVAVIDCAALEPAQATVPAVGSGEGLTGAPTVNLPLVAIGHGRSGDKGAHLNIGIIARDAAFEALILDQVTADRVGEWLVHLGSTAVERFRLPGIGAVNFLLLNGLGEGGTASLRFDAQGKAVAQQLLDLPVRVPVPLLDHPALADIPEVRAVRRQRSQA